MVWFRRRTKRKPTTRGRPKEPNNFEKPKGHHPTKRKLRPILRNPLLGEILHFDTMGSQYLAFFHFLVGIRNQSFSQDFVHQHLFTEPPRPGAPRRPSRAPRPGRQLLGLALHLLQRQRVACGWMPRARFGAAGSGERSRGWTRKPSRHHLRKPGMIRFPLQMPRKRWFQMVSKWCRMWRWAPKSKSYP